MTKQVRHKRIKRSKRRFGKNVGNSYSAGSVTKNGIYTYPKIRKGKIQMNKNLKEQLQLSIVNQHLLDELDRVHFFTKKYRLEDVK